MRTLAVGAIGIGLAFAVGVSGAPGLAVSAATGWLADTGRVDLDSPVGEAVRVAFPGVRHRGPDGPRGVTTRVSLHAP